MVGEEVRTRVLTALAEVAPDITICDDPLDVADLYIDPDGHAFMHKGVTDPVRRALTWRALKLAGGPLQICQSCAAVSGLSAHDCDHGPEWR